MDSDTITHGADSDGPTLRLVDSDSDTIDAMYSGPSGRLILASNTASGAYLDRDAARALYAYLGEYLNTACVPGCVAEGDHRATGCITVNPDAFDPTCERTDHLTSSCEHPESILEEAQAAIYGDREDDYGSPRDNWTRTAILWTGLLQHKLADGEYITPEDGLRCMVAVKLARDVHSPKRDNRVDGAGYFAVLDRLETGK